jgi:hypothetical protein
MLGCAIAAVVAMVVVAGFAVLAGAAGVVFSLS